jgi:sulfoxide reductase heme-binding subunit YedZ
MDRPRRSLLSWAVTAACLVPLALLVWDVWRGGLGANPIQAVELRTGKPAFVLLVVSLTVSPAARLTGWSWLRPLRRLLGLWAFFYACLHALTFAGLDYGFDLRLLPEALFQKRFALAGVAAFAVLLPLAITSTRSWQRRLGRDWRRLHRLAYLAGLLAAIHYIWQTKADVTQPLLWAIALALLLLARLLSCFRDRRSSRLETSEPTTSAPP